MSNMPRTTTDTGAQTEEMTPRNIGPTVASKINNGRDPGKVHNPSPVKTVFIFIAFILLDKMTTQCGSFPFGIFEPSV